MPVPPRRGPQDPVAEKVDPAPDFDQQPPSDAQTATMSPPGEADPSEGTIDPAEMMMPPEVPPAPSPVPEEDPSHGVFDSMEALAEEPPTPELMDSLISETDRIHAKLADDPMPRPPLLDKSDEDLVTIFRGRLREAATFRAPLEKSWLVAFRQYNQYSPPGEIPWKSKIYLPYVRALVGAAIPSAVAASFNSGTILEIKPVRPEWEKNALSMEHLLQWHLTEKVRARKAWRHFLHYRTLYGTGIVKTGWRREGKMLRVRQPVYDDVDETGAPLPPGQQGPMLGHKKALKWVDIHNHPRLECVDLWNALPAPWTRLDHLPYFIERWEGTREEALAMAKAGAMGEEAGLDADGNPQTPEEAVAAWFEENPNFANLDSSSMEVQMSTRASVLQSIGYQSPLDQQGASDTDGDAGPNPCVMYIYSTADVMIFFSGDGKARILGKQGNPFDLCELPYVISQFDDILPGFVWGAGIGMVAGPIQNQINFDINHSNDGRRLAQNPMVKRRRYGSSLMGDLTNRPGAVWDVREMDDIEPVELQDLSSRAIEWIGTLVGFGDRATGIGDLQRGLGDQGVDTATEASIVDSNAITRRLVHSEEIRDAWHEVGRQLVSHELQFFDEEQMLQVAGADGLSWTWEKITPEAIYGEFTVVPRMSMTRSDVVLQRRDWLGHIQAFNGDPLTNQYELRKRYWQAFDQDNLDALLQPPPTPPVPPEHEEILLNNGLEAPVSPDDDDLAHIQTHGMGLMALKADPLPNTMAISAHERHIAEHQKSMAEKAALLTMGAQATAAGGNEPQGKKMGAPQAGKVRDKATTLGQNQGSDGPPGRSPGPSNPPGRPTKKPAR